MPRPDYTLSAPVSRSTAHKRRRSAALRTGTWQPYTDPTAAMNRIIALRTAGWSREALHHATTVSLIGIERLMRGKRTKIRPATERRILTADLDPRRIPRHLLVPAIGTQRRIAALTYLCWGYKDMAAQCDLGWTVFERAMNRRRVNAGIAADVADLYDKLWRHRGPSPKSGTLARKRGRHGPLAWDDHAIDDPQAVPIGSEVTPCQPSHA